MLQKLYCNFYFAIDVSSLPRHIYVQIKLSEAFYQFVWIIVYHSQYISYESKLFIFENHMYRWVSSWLIAYLKHKAYSFLSHSQEGLVTCVMEHRSFFF